MKSNSLSLLEEKSLSEGKVLFVDDWGNLNENHQKVWFVWYREKGEKYRILLKTFTTNKEKILVYRKELLKKMNEKNCEVSLGNINILNGSMQLFAEEFKCD